MATTVWTDALADNVAGLSNYHIRRIIPNAEITDLNGNRVRVEFTFDTGTGSTIDLAYIGKRSGSTFDIVAGTLTKLTFSGSDSSGSQTGTLYSDWVPFTSSGTDDLIVSWDLGASTEQSIASEANVCKTWAATDGAAQAAAPAAGSASSYVYYISKIDVNTVVSKGSLGIGAPLIF